MERPQTTLASSAGLRTGTDRDWPATTSTAFRCGPHGGIEGFSSLFGYSRPRFGDSASSDAGFVVLLNSNVSGQARLRIASLAVRYLKAGVAAAGSGSRPTCRGSVPVARRLHHDANPRSQATAFLGWLFSGQTITVNGTRLRSVARIRRRDRSDSGVRTMFRLPKESEATRVFTTNEHERAGPRRGNRRPALCRTVAAVARGNRSLARAGVGRSGVDAAPLGRALDRACASREAVRLLAAQGLSTGLRHRGRAVGGGDHGRHGQGARHAKRLDRVVLPRHHALARHFDPCVRVHARRVACPRRHVAARIRDADLGCGRDPLRVSRVVGDDRVPGLGVPQSRFGQVRRHVSSAAAPRSVEYAALGAPVRRTPARPRPP